MTARKTYRDIELWEVCDAIDQQAIAGTCSAFERVAYGTTKVALGKLSFSIFETLSEIGRSKGDAYRIINSSAAAVETVKPLKLARLLTPPPDLDAVRASVNVLGVHARGYFDVVQKTGVDAETFRGVGDGEGAKNARCVNEFVSQARAMVQSSWFKRRYAVVERNCQKGFEQAEALIKSAYRRCESLTVVRLDLYQPQAGVADPSQRLRYLTGLLMHSIKDSTVYQSIAGYVIGYDYSENFGVNAHLMLLAEGDWSADEVGGLVAGQWVQKINGGRGRAVLCRNHPNRHKNIGNCVVHREDGYLNYEILASLAQWSKVGLFMPISEGLDVTRLK